MFDAIKKLFKKKPAVKLSAKEQATVDGLPYVTVIKVDIDVNTPRLGSFEIDWNSYFVDMLRKHGYVGKTDEQIVDQWFTDLCRNVVLETYEQEQADPAARVTKKDLGNGRTEIG